MRWKSEGKNTGGERRKRDAVPQDTPHIANTPGNNDNNESRKEQDYKNMDTRIQLKNQVSSHKKYFDCLCWKNGYRTIKIWKRITMESRELFNSKAH